MSNLTTLLLLADGRFPAGGHAHSGGLEPSVALRRVNDLDDLATFLRGRLATTGSVAAAFAAVSCARAETVSLDEIEAEFDARNPSPAARQASRRQGRALARAGATVWPSAPVTAAVERPGGVHHPVAVGLVAASAGLDPGQAALVAAYGAVTGPASAAVRLLGLDPYLVQAVLAGLAADCDQVVAAAVRYVAAPLASLPAGGAPLLDISAEIHASWEVRLFAS